MSLSECLTNIRNLEGIIDFENCIYFAGLICENIPGSFFIVNFRNPKTDMFNNEFYEERPWEIPPTYQELQ
jgi:hypothetical protein